MYFALVEKEDGSAFGVRFPDVPGCFSAADAEGDILANAIDALDLHLDGEEAPAARGHSEIAADPEVAEALAGGAYLLAVPLIRKTERSVRVNLSMDSGTVAAIDEAAKALKLTRSAFLAQAAKHEIERI